MPGANQGLTWVCLTQDKEATPKAKTPLKANNSIAKPVAVHPQVYLPPTGALASQCSIDHCCAQSTQRHRGVQARLCLTPHGTLRSGARARPGSAARRRA